MGVFYFYYLRDELKDKKRRITVEFGGAIHDKQPIDASLHVWPMRCQSVMKVLQMSLSLTCVGYVGTESAQD